MGSRARLPPNERVARIIVAPCGAFAGEGARRSKRGGFYSSLLGKDRSSASCPHAARVSWTIKRPADLMIGGAQYLQVVLRGSVRCGLAPGNALRVSQFHSQNQRGVFEGLRSAPAVLYLHHQEVLVLPETHNAATLIEDHK